MNKEKDRLLEIVEDGQITPDEYKDFFDFVGRMYRYKINEAQIENRKDNKTSKKSN